MILLRYRYSIVYEKVLFFKEQVRPGLDASIPADKSSVLVFGKLLLSLLFSLFVFNFKPVEAINIFISYCKETQQDIEFVPVYAIFYHRVMIICLVC